MIEVEAKARINNPELFRRKAGRIGKYIGKEKKIDDYYSLERDKYPKKSLRIRKRKGFCEVNFKQLISDVKKVYAKKEVEFKIDDISGFLDLIENFGFRKWLRKTKISEIYRINKNFHIEINNIKGLGFFLEVEYLTDSDIYRARKRVLNILSSLGINKKDIIKTGYTKMLWDKMH